MADTLKVKVTNTSDGPRIFNGIVTALIHAGETVDAIEVTPGELESMRATGYFVIDGGEAQEPGPLDGSVEELKAHLATVTDADAVQALIDAETGGKSRKGALEALEARRDELLA